MAEKEQVGGDWRDLSACLEEDPELFFPIGKTGPAAEQIEAAKAVCTGCPVLAQCRVWALSHPSLTDHGVWGGMSEDERRAELRRRRRRGDATGVAA
jgi:WhiB family redox-sensing transcriptional regulator